MSRFGLGLAMALAVCVPGVALAQTVGLKPEEVVKARQSGMDMTSGIVGLMKTGIAAGADVKGFEESAAALVAWAEAYPHLFPDGTQTAAGTKAKAEIWSDRAGFEKASAAFLTASNNLLAAAKSGDKAAFATAFAAEGQSCGGCHRAYKAR